MDDFHPIVLAHLQKLVTVAVQLHGPSDEHLRAQAADVIAFFAGPARQHSEDEERQIFVRLLDSDNPQVRSAAERLREDHAWIELAWLDIEPQLAAVAAGASVDDAHAIRSAVDAFVAMTREHMTVEESLLAVIAPAAKVLGSQPRFSPSR